jgi:phosphate acetyltransferase/phosphate butyryltransferase
MSPDEAARTAVQMIREGKADILMKGLINTDTLLHAILDKEHGLLPKGKVLTHLAVVQIPTYNKLLFFSDAAVIPRPSLQQRIEMIWYAIHTCRDFGIKQPRIALIHFSEKVSAKFQNSLDYVNLVELAEAGEFGDVIIDGPLDVKSACEESAADIKGIVSPINGQADVLIFPNIEAGNTFYKTVSLFAKAEMAGLLQGPICPVVLPSRSDSGLSKYYSIAMACLTCKN